MLPNGVRLLHSLEKQYDPEPMNKWIRNNWMLSVYASAIYLVVIYAGRRFMTDKNPYELRKILLLWNVGLAVFSIMGAYVMAPSLYGIVSKEGFVRSVCWTDVIHLDYKALWSTLFTLSKLLELFDTAFIVLRKSPLIFLHYYHHVTVLMYTWYSHAHIIASAHWFGSMNYMVHSIMYSYYVLRSAGFKLPTASMQAITILQLLQMIIGLVCNYTASQLLKEGKNCMMTWDHVYITYVLYGSYALLFVHFFYQKYMTKRTKQE